MVDAQGAQFAVWKAGTGVRFTGRTKPGDADWLEVTSPDSKKTGYVYGFHTQAATQPGGLDPAAITLMESAGYGKTWALNDCVKGMKIGLDITGTMGNGNEFARNLARRKGWQGLGQISLDQVRTGDVVSFTKGRFGHVAFAVRKAGGLGTYGVLKGVLGPGPWLSGGYYVTRKAGPDWSSPDWSSTPISRGLYPSPTGRAR